MDTSARNNILQKAIFSTRRRLIVYFKSDAPDPIKVMSIHPMFGKNSRLPAPCQQTRKGRSQLTFETSRFSRESWSILGEIPKNLNLTYAYRGSSPRKQLPTMFDRQIEAIKLYMQEKCTLDIDHAEVYLIPQREAGHFFGDPTVSRGQPKRRRRIGRHLHSGCVFCRIFCCCVFFFVVLFKKLFLTKCTRFATPPCGPRIPCVTF